MIEKLIQAEKEIANVIPTLSEINIRYIIYGRHRIIAILQNVDNDSKSLLYTYYCESCNEIVGKNQQDDHSGHILKRI